jgi:hypothetical protein
MLDIQDHFSLLDAILQFVFCVTHAVLAILDLTTLVFFWLAILDHNSFYV